MYEGRSFQDRLKAATACDMVEELKARHAYLHGISYSREEYDIFWHKSEHTTFGHGWGRMCGYDTEFCYNMLPNEDKMAVLDNFNNMNFYPEYMAHDLRSTGHSGPHALASSVIEVSDDGNSARSWYSTPGVLMGTVGNDFQHRNGVWLWERYGSDFIYINGEWLWFHEQVCPDIMGMYDTGNWAYDKYLMYVESDGEAEGGPLFPDFDDPRVEYHPSGYPAKLSEEFENHKNWNVDQTVQYTVVPPTKYPYLCEEHTYSTGRNNAYATTIDKDFSSKYCGE